MNTILNLVATLERAERINHNQPEPLEAEPEQKNIKLWRGLKLDNTTKKDWVVFNDMQFFCMNPTTEKEKEHKKKLVEWARKNQYKVQYIVMNKTEYEIYNWRP